MSDAERRLPPGWQHGTARLPAEAAVDFRALLAGLLELDLHDALGGIAAIVQARLAQVRGESPQAADPVFTAYDILKAHDVPEITRILPHCAALLATGIDRSTGGT